MSEDLRGSVGAGVATALTLHFLQIVIIPAAGLLGAGGSFIIIAIAAWSLTQFLYLGPAAWSARRKGQTETAKGILIVAGIGVLLNGACDASLMLTR